MPLLRAVCRLAALPLLRPDAPVNTSPLPIFAQPRHAIAVLHLALPSLCVASPVVSHPVLSHRRLSFTLRFFASPCLCQSDRVRAMPLLGVTFRYRAFANLCRAQRRAVPPLHLPSAPGCALPLLIYSP